MFRVGDTILSDAIALTKFSCDLPKCKGACCVVGDAGAPVTKEEIPQLEKAWNLLAEELDSASREVVKHSGIVQKSKYQKFSISCRESGECIFVDYEGGHARCSIQSAFREGRLDWEKPLSCHLYPVRLRKSGDIEYANFEYEEKNCSPACIKGREENVYLSDFLEKPLVRRYGKAWYSDFKEKCRDIRNNNEEAAVK